MLGEPSHPPGGARCAHSLWVSLCTLSPSLYYPAVRTTAATASRLAAAAAALPLAALQRRDLWPLPEILPGQAATEGSRGITGTVEANTGENTEERVEVNDRATAEARVRGGKEGGARAVGEALVQVQGDKEAFI